MRARVSEETLQKGFCSPEGARCSPNLSTAGYLQLTVSPVEVQFFYITHTNNTDSGNVGLFGFIMFFVLNNMLFYFCFAHPSNIFRFERLGGFFLPLNVSEVWTECQMFQPLFDPDKRDVFLHTSNIVNYFTNIVAVVQTSASKS